MEILWIYLVTINVVTFLVYRADKQRARKRKRRISEKALFTWAVFGGSAGAFAGMRFFRHKTNKPQFYLGIPTTLLVQIMVILIVLRLL